MAPDYTIREAERADRETLVAFTLRQAREAEGLELDPAGARRGVEGAFEEPPRATYWVAESEDGRVVASISVVTEWSDFHGGDYWWVQSVFVVPEHRGGGLVARLLDHLARVARDAGALDLRLYVHEANARAICAYRRSGFAEAPYRIMNRILREEGSPDAAPASENGHRR